MNENLEALAIICGGALVVSIVVALMMSKRIRSSGLVRAIRDQFSSERRAPR